MPALRIDNRAQAREGRAQTPCSECCGTTEPPQPGDVVIANCDTGQCAGNDFVPAGTYRFVISGNAVCAPGGFTPGAVIGQDRPVIEYAGLCWFVERTYNPDSADDRLLRRLQASEFLCIPTGLAGDGCNDDRCTATKYVRMRPCPAFEDRYGPGDRLIYTCAQALLAIIASGECPIGRTAFNDVYNPTGGVCDPQTVCLTPDTTDSITDDQVGGNIVFIQPINLGLAFGQDRDENCCQCSALFFQGPGSACDQKCRYDTREMWGLLLQENQRCCGACGTVSGTGSWRFSNVLTGLDARPNTGDLLRLTTLSTGTWVVNPDGTIVGTRTDFSEQVLANGQTTVIIDNRDEPFSFGFGEDCPPLVAGVYRIPLAFVGQRVNLNLPASPPVNEVISRFCTLYREQQSWLETVSQLRTEAGWDMQVQINYLPGQCGPVGCGVGLVPLPPNVQPPDLDTPITSGLTPLRMDPLTGIMLYRWLGIEWIGVPKPLRIVGFLLRRRVPPYGCGCVRALKHLWIHARRLWGTDKGCGCSLAGA